MADDQYENTNAGELRDILKSITGELSRQRSIQAESAAEYRKMDSIARQLQDTTMGISNVSSEELAKLKEKNQNHIKELQYQAERLARQKVGLGFEGQINQATIDRLKFLDKLTIQEEAILRAAADKFEIEKDLTAEIEDQYKKRLVFEKQVNSSLGVSGAIVGGIDKVMDKLGINSGIFKDHIKQASKAMEDAAKNAALNGEHISRTAVMMKGLGVLAKGFGKALTDPLTIITAILDGFFRVNKATVDVQRLTGQYETSIAGVNSRLATSAQFLQTAAEITKQWGVSATLVFSPDQIAQIAEAKNLLGLSAEQAGRMGMLMKTTGKSADEIGEGIYGMVNAYNGANRAGIAHGVVLQDVLSASDSITASLGNSEKRIGAAAVAARGLGMSLSEVDAIAGNLMNFEDSIGNELEAQLLTGKNINLSKARELALNNDLEGVANELKKNGASAAEFANMNRIQQESLAKALGMSRDQLAKSVLTQEAMNGMTDEQVAKARGVTLEQSKAMDVQEKMQIGMQKLAEAFAPVLDVIVNLVDGLMLVVGPVAKVIAMVSGNPIGKAILLAVVATKLLGASIGGVGTAFGSMYKMGKDSVTGLIGLFKQGGLTSMIDKIKGGFGVGTGKMITNLTGKTPEVASAAKAVPEKTGGGMSSLTDSIQKIKPSQLLAGGAALVMVAASVFIFAKAAQEFATVSWEDMAKAGVGLLGLVGALAAVGAIMMSGVGAVAILAGAAAIVVMAGGLFILGKALQEIGTGMNLMAPALTVLDSLGSKAAALATVQASLMGIASGLKEIEASGTGAIPVLDKLNSLGGSKSIGESKTKADEGSLAAVEAKLTELIAAVKTGGHVYIDSNKVGRAQVLGSYKSA